VLRGNPNSGSINFTASTTGTTVVTPLLSNDVGYVAPSGFSLGATTPVYYDIATTATLSGS